MLVIRFYNLNFGHYPEELLFESTVGDVIIGSFVVYVLAKSAFSIRESAIDNLNTSNTLLDKSFQEKRHLLAILFHDLNNHLTTASMSINSKKIANIDNDDLKDKIFKIKRSLDSMNKIILNVRNQEKVKEGKMTLELESISVLEVFNETKFVFEEKLKAKNLNLIFINENNIAPYIFAEKIAFGNNILNNFISNAIKFSSQGHEIIVSIEIDKENNKMMKINILDSGPGIPKLLQSKLFDYNAQTNRLGSEGEKGSGYGLPIVKSTLDQFNGHISISSQSTEDGFDKTFTKISIFLPIEKAFDKSA